MVCFETYSVDGPESGEGKEPVDEAETERADQGSELGETSVDEDGGGVEGDDVDTAHLLGNHDGESSQVGTADSGDGEELSEAGDVVGLANELLLNLELSGDVVDVAGDLDGVVAENGQRLPGIGVAALLHVPTRRLGAEVDEAQKGDGRDEGSAEHQTPVDILDVVDSQVESASQEDTKGRPHFFKDC